MGPERAQPRRRRVSLRVLGLLAAAAAAAAGTAQARDPPYGAVASPALARCDGLHWSGQLARARRCYLKLASQPSTPTGIRAEAAWALGDARTANQWFRQAVAAHPKNAQLRVRWGELYVQTHQDEEALQLFREALKRDPGNDWARVGAAGVLVDEFQQQAGRDLNAVLADPRAPPGARLRALLLQARVGLENDEIASGRDALEKAVALARQAHLSMLQVDALRAGLDVLHGIGSSPWTAAALKLDPAYGEAYAMPAHFEVLTFHYRQAIALYRKAVQVQPDLWSAHLGLANNLLREEQIAEARAQLLIAYKGDPYNPVTGNTLRLLGTLGKFETLKYGRTGAQPEPDATHPALILRIDRAEAPVLAPYASRLVQQAIASYSRQYHFQLKQPAIIEIYANHDDFSVRTAGLPGIGLLGVTFGYVVAIDSPEARPVDEFHWGSALWHEMGHVFTLSCTDHRVPRWYTEGLSVYQEWTTGPIKGVQIPPYALVDLAHGRALPIAELDGGFIHPTYAEQVEVSYMQAALICVFIDQRWGFGKLDALLYEFLHTRDTPTAIHAVLGLTAAQFDARFHAFLERRYGRLFAHIDQWSRERARATQLAQRGDWGEAIVSAEAALSLLPQDVEPGSPYLVLAQAYAAGHRSSLQLQTLEDYWKRGGYDPGALKRLAGLLEAAGRHDQAIAALESVNLVAPFDYRLHGRLGDWLLAAGRPGQALREYRVASALNPPDVALEHLRLARAEYALHRPGPARAEVFKALESAPDYQPAQRLLLRIEKDGPGAARH